MSICGADKILFFKIMGYYDKKYTPEPRCHYKYKYEKMMEISETLFKNKTVENWLDLGCGDGRLTYKLSKYCSQMIGVDLSEDKIDLAKKLYPSICFKKASILETLNKMDSNFADVISETDVFYYFSDDMLSVTIREIERVIKKKGLFITSSVDADRIIESSEKLRILSSYIVRLPIIDIHKLFWFFEYPFIKLEYLNQNRKDMNEANTNKYRLIIKIMHKHPRSSRIVLNLSKVPRKIIAILYNSVAFHKLTLISKRKEALYVIFKKV